MPKNIEAEDWAAYCRVVKHQRRYFFHHVKVNEQPLLYCQSVIEDTAGRLCDTPFVLGAGERLFRCRPNPSRFLSSDYAKELGPPPPALARASRMSAAGISVFYLASSAETALAETANAPGEFAVAEFEVGGEVVVIDLVDLSTQPDPKFRDFLRHCVSDMSKPIARDDRVHIDYVPTQIFTEQFSYNWIDSNNRPIKGLRFPSSITGDPVYVFFINHDQFQETGCPIKYVGHSLTDYDPSLTA